MEFPQDKFKLKNDRYAKRRGSPHKFLYLACSNCETPTMVYQKDGPGKLLRCYADRIVWPPDLVEELTDLSASTIKNAANLACNACSDLIGVPMVYEPENRAAYRLVPGSLHIYGSLEKAAQNETGD